MHSIAALCLSLHFLGMATLPSAAGTLGAGRVYVAGSRPSGLGPGPRHTRDSMLPDPIAAAGILQWVLLGPSWQPPCPGTVPTETRRSWQDTWLPEQCWWQQVPQATARATARAVGSAQGEISCCSVTSGSSVSAGARVGCNPMATVSVQVCNVGKQSTRQAQPAGRGAGVPPTQCCTLGSYMTAPFPVQVNMTFLTCPNWQLGITGHEEKGMTPRISLKQW